MPTAKTDANAGKQTLPQALADLRQSFRMQPDARFLDAVSEVHHMITLQARQPVATQWRNGMWLIRYNGLEVGTLREYADWWEQFDMLTHWTAKLAESNLFYISRRGLRDKEIQNEVDQFAPVNLIGATRLAGSKWEGNRDQSILIPATEALVYLNLQAMDDMQMTDRLCARALASMALCNRTESDDKVRNQCLMAEVMGYHGYALGRAQKLDAKDPVRLLLENNADQLRKMLDAHPSRKLTFFYMRALSQLEDRDSWNAIAQSAITNDTEMTLPFLYTFHNLASVDSLLPLGSLVMLATTTEAENKGLQKYVLAVAALTWSYEKTEASQEWMLRDLLSQFEDVLKSMRIPQEGPFMDRKMVECFYRGYFYSAVAILGQSYIEAPSAVEKCEQFANAIHVKEPGPAQELERWFKDRIAYYAKKAQPSVLESDLASIRDLGRNALIMTYGDLGRILVFNQSDRLLELGQMMFGRLDARPENLTILAAMVKEYMLYLPLARDIFVAAGNLGANDLRPGNISYLSRTQDQAKIKAQLKKNNLTPENRLTYLRYLEEYEVAAPQRMRSEYQKLLKLSPGRNDLTKAYISYLLRSKQTEEAVKVSRQWRNAVTDKGSTEWADASITLAQALARLNKVSEAAAIIDAMPDATHELMDWIELKATLCQKAGKADESEAWSKEALDRNPDELKTIAFCLKLYWLEKNYAAAAKLARAKSKYIRRFEWRAYIAPDFAEVFDKDLNAASLAAQAMGDVGVTSADTIGGLAAGLNDLNEPDLAFTVLGSVKSDPSQAIAKLGTAYLYLTGWKGEKAATDWLKSEVPPERRNLFAPVAFEMGQHDLLWNFIPAQPQGEGAERVWLLRAADISSNGLRDKKAKRAVLEAHFTETDQFEHRLGRYLLDLPGGKEILMMPLGADELCQAAFFVGWKALREGHDFYEDISWYRLALETDRTNMEEYSWAWRWSLDIVATLRESRILEDQVAFSLRIVDKPRVKPKRIDLTTGREVVAHAYYDVEVKILPKPKKGTAKAAGKTRVAR